jgi:hypothetical protein
MMDRPNDSAQRGPLHHAKKWPGGDAIEHSLVASGAAGDNDEVPCKI